ncbi:hypothetical protein BFL38_03210 [Brachyspira hampsonii]|uniref:RNA polymerase sigma-70 domain-containing protein n=1 Tax=Brachyspira hampsonii TaxID=1287055 RepID=A0A1E5NC69_9SPIR|nr:sigma-70 family RNA polymerase sigma factor [Brachyspira hampsonii]OEJ13770.1 hypothetical protein BFL38_03210 [Brachyspira hampsonii]
MRYEDKIPNITNDNEHEYWQEFKNTHSPYIREAFIFKYSPLVKYAANKIYVNMWSDKNIEFQDLIGFGTFGLIDAIDKYNPNIDIKFKTYATTKISRAIYDELIKLDCPSEYKRVIEYAEDDSDEITVIDRLKSHSNYEYFSEKEKIKDKILSTFKKLPREEKNLLILYYCYDITLKNIAKLLDVSESRISQLHTKAIKNIKKIIENIDILEPSLSRNTKPQKMTDIFIIPISQYNETMKNYIETSTAYLSDVWYVDDDYDEISVIDTLKSKTNHKYSTDMKYAKNKIADLLKNMPKKVTKSAIIMIQDKNR